MRNLLKGRHSSLNGLIIRKKVIMITMHGYFDLKENRSEADFADAYDQFATHLLERDLIIASLCLTRPKFRF